LWQRRVRRALVALIAVGSLGCVMSVYMALRPAPMVEVPEVNNPGPGAREAQTSLDEWLASDPAPLPGGRIVAWDRSQEHPWTRGDAGAGGDRWPAYTLWSHQFTVVDGSGSLYQTVVETAVGAGGQVRVVANPSLTPSGAPLGDQPQGPTWPGWEAGGSSEVVGQAVAAWAEAWGSGDATKLRVAVGDPDTGHAYQPLGGAESLTCQVAQVARERAGEPPGVDPSRALARVDCVPVWAGSAAGAGPSAPTTAGTRQARPFTLDLLVDGADTGAPRVVAWGGPGAGAGLAKYGNAITPGLLTSPAPRTSAESGR
jgi:hypothetical protein